MSALDPQALRKAFAAHPSGVVAVCATVGGERVGMAMSSFVPVSLSPPLVAVCVQATSSTWPLLARSPRLGVSVLAGHHAGAVRTLARKSGDRFEGVATWRGARGALYVEGSPLALEVSVHQTVQAGDHRVVLLAVHAVAGNGHVPPIVFHGSVLRTLGATSVA